MAIIKTEAVVLRTRKQGETSKILSLYTKNFGKISVIAKGARSIKSKYLGALETLNYISIIIYRKEQRSLQYLREADIIHSFPDIHAQLGKMALAAIPCELIDKTEEDDHCNTAVFNLLIEFLNTLEKSQKGQKNILRNFYLTFLSISGFEPKLNSCSICSEQTHQGPIFINMENGNYCCENCSSQREFALSFKALEFLRWLQKNAVSRSDKIKVTSAIGKEMDLFLSNYLNVHIDNLNDLKSIKYLNQLSNDFEKK